MAMFEKAEDEYNELISKKSIIEVCSSQSVDMLSYYDFTYDNMPLIEWQVKNQDGDWRAGWKEEGNIKGYLD